MKTTPPDSAPAALPGSSELLTLPEAARTLRISRDTLFKLLRTGDLKSCRVGSRRFVPRFAIDDFIRENTA